jgi:internalin A
MMDKPKEIIDIEKQYNIVLSKVNKEFSIRNLKNRNTFDLNDNGQVVGLNLSENQILDSFHFDKLKQLKSLNLRNNKISDFSFLSELKELKELDIDNNDISDISFLRDLSQLTYLGLRGIRYNKNDNKNIDFSLLNELINLTTLDIGFNSISDISFLKNLSNLKSLKLFYNEVSDISFLEELEQLTYLDLSNNSIIDISPIVNLKLLESLELDNNFIIDISSLSQLNKLKSLDLSNNQILDFSSLEKLFLLDILDLSGNQILDIKFIETLKSLKTLYLADNNISNFSFLSNLNELDILDISGNVISDISFLKYLTKKITVLNMSNTQISNFSELKEFVFFKSLELTNNNISDISFLQGQKRLTKLDLSSNDISDLTYLNNCSELIELDLNENNISDLSAFATLDKIDKLDLSGNIISDISSIKDLKRLTTLDLSRNNISDISDLQYLIKIEELILFDNQISDISILKYLKELTLLDLSHNKISKISSLIELKELNQLSLDDNLINDIPVVKKLIFELKKLDEFYLHENSIALPNECLSELEQLRAYFVDAEKGTTEKRNIKLLFIGDGCVGKSTLLNHLNKLEKPKEIDVNERTEGIQLDIWQDVLPDVKVSVWDFGGQEIMHSTHRLFLGEKAVYVLVWCKETKKKCSQFENHPLSYWLDFIADYGKESIVLLVENIIDLEFDDKEFPDDKKLQELVNHYKKRKIELITTHHRFDCLNNTDEIESFKDIIKNKIKSVIRQYPINDYPSNWFSLQEILEIEKKKNKTITLDRFNEFAEKLDISCHSAILSYFNATGVVGYFENLFEDRIILQLNWVLDAIYASIKLKDNPLIRKKGKLLEADFNDIWNDYSKSEKSLFITYMLRSNLLARPSRYDIERDYDYLLPALFEDIKYRDAIKWDDKPSYIVVKFNFVFGAILQQLQVRILNHCHYKEEETFYKNYISFTDKNNFDAWIEMIEKQKELRIFSQHDYLNQTILKELNDIYPLDRTQIILRKGEEEKEYKFDSKIDNKFDKLKEEKKNEIVIKEEMKDIIKVFVTYCWNDVNGDFDEEHQNKVGKFVTQLKTKWKIDASFDLEKTETNFIKMMYDNLLKNNKVIIILSHGYAKKANEFKGGVGTEYKAIINDIENNPSKYIFVSFNGRDYEIYPFGFQGNDTIVIEGDLVDADSVLPDQQNRLVAKLTDEPLVDIPELGGKTPKVRKIKF